MQMSSRRARAVLMSLALQAVIAVVAMAARSPLSRSTPVDARVAQPPTTALFTVLAGVGIVMRGALARMLWRGCRRKDDLPELEPMRVEASRIARLLAILLPFALVAAAVLGSK